MFFVNRYSCLVNSQPILSVFTFWLFELIRLPSPSPRYPLQSHGWFPKTANKIGQYPAWGENEVSQLSVGNSPPIAEWRLLALLDNCQPSIAFFPPPERVPILTDLNKVFDEDIVGGHISSGGASGYCFDIVDWYRGRGGWPPRGGHPNCTNWSWCVQVTMRTGMTSGVLRLCLSNAQRTYPVGTVRLRTGSWEHLDDGGDGTFWDLQTMA